MGKKSRLENRILNNRIKKFAQKSEKISSNKDSQSHRLFMLKQKSVIANEMKRKKFYNLQNNTVSKKIESRLSKCNVCDKITHKIFQHYIKSEDRVKQMCTECHETALSLEKILWNNSRETISKMKEQKRKELESERQKKQWRSIHELQKKYSEKHYGNDVWYKPKRKDIPASGSPFEYS